MEENRKSMKTWMGLRNSVVGGVHSVNAGQGGKVNVSWDSENVSTFVFKIYFLGYKCGGLNNCNGYHHIVLLCS